MCENNVCVKVVLITRMLEPNSEFNLKCEASNEDGVCCLNNGNLIVVLGNKLEVLDAKISDIIVSKLTGIKCTTFRKTDDVYIAYHWNGIEKEDQVDFEKSIISALRDVCHVQGVRRYTSESSGTMYYENLKELLSKHDRNEISPTQELISLLWSAKLRIKLKLLHYILDISTSQRKMNDIREEVRLLIEDQENEEETLIQSFRIINSKVFKEMIQLVKSKDIHSAKFESCRQEFLTG